MNARAAIVRGATVATTLVLWAAAPASAATARTGMALAASAADAWADDARLVWIENDTPVDASGQADAWGYLYYSPTLHAMRSWSVRGSEIVHAEDQAVIAAAPTVDPDWEDSSTVVSAAWREVGSERAASGTAHLASLVLARGIFTVETAWVAVFDTGAGPRDFLVFDAHGGSLLKRWRG